MNKASKIDKSQEMCYCVTVYSLLKGGVDNRYCS